ncbi:MAG: 50S ribosomal protein L24e [Desulfurococcaceae archaeon]
MPKLVNCTFCGNQLEPGSGLMYVLNDGSTLWFCCRKCLKSYLMERDPRKLKWTKKYKQETL